MGRWDSTGFDGLQAGAEDKGVYFSPQWLCGQRCPLPGDFPPVFPSLEVNGGDCMQWAALAASLRTSLSPPVLGGGPVGASRGGAHPPREGRRQPLAGTPAWITPTTPQGKGRRRHPQIEGRQPPPQWTWPPRPRTLFDDTPPHRPHPSPPLPKRWRLTRPRFSCHVAAPTPPSPPSSSPATARAPPTPCPPQPQPPLPPPPLTAPDQQRRPAATGCGPAWSAWTMEGGRGKGGRGERA